MNELVPFEFDGFRVQQACWTDARSVRFPRIEVGRLFGAKGRRPDQAIAKIFQHYPELNRLGTVATVATVDGKQRKVSVYDFREIYTLAIHSDLPGARDYLLKFPALLEAEIRGRLFCPGVPPLAQYIERIVGLPKRDPQRIAVRREALAALGCHHSIFDRWVQRRLAGQAVGVRKRPVGVFFKGVPEETRALAMKLMSEIRDAKIVDIAKVLDGKISCHALSRYRIHLRETAAAAA